MSKNSHYLLFIDKTPVNEDLKSYFLKSNIEIIQQDTLEFFLPECSSLYGGKSIKNSTLAPPHPPSMSGKKGKRKDAHWENGIPIAILIHWSLLKKRPEIIKQFYNEYLLPLLVINDAHDEDSRILMLETGADAYMIQPLDPHELHARINAITRRIIRFQQKQEKQVILFNHWRMYLASRQVFNDKNQEVQLSVGEYDLLLAFVQKPQQILDRELLLQITKNSHWNAFDRRIDLQISRLRHKIEQDAEKPTLIQTIRNQGYLFTAKTTLIKEGSK